MLAGGADDAMMAAVAADGNARAAEAAVPAAIGEEGGDGGGDVRKRALDIGWRVVRLKTRSLYQGNNHTCQSRKSRLQ
jgi:hypothetical protein